MCSGYCWEPDSSITKDSACQKSTKRIKSYLVKPKVTPETSELNEPKGKYVLNKIHLWGVVVSILNVSIVFLNTYETLRRSDGSGNAGTLLGS